MANNHDKLWFQSRANQTAIQRAREAILQLGRSLPCRIVAVSGAMVTVAFEVDSAPWALPQITIPKAESNWIRMPTQVGDLGITIPADTYIGNISGVTTSIPSINVKPGNLSALVFVPVSNANSPPQDQNAAICQGPNGFVGQTTTGTASSAVVNTSGTTVTYGANTVKLDGTSATVTFGSNTLVVDAAAITLTVGTTVLLINASGVTITVDGVTYSFSSTDATFNGIPFGTHSHTQGNDSAGNTEQNVGPPI